MAHRVRRRRHHDRARGIRLKALVERTGVKFIIDPDIKPAPVTVDIEQGFAQGSGADTLVGVEGAGADDGYYIYSSEDLFCLKFEIG